MRLAHAFAVIVLAASLVGSAATPGAAQSLGVVVSPVLTIESDRLFAQSAFGKRVARELEAEEAVLRAENRKIEAELAEEEKRLTELRPTLSAEDFRALSDAFDERVQVIRREQDRKAIAIGQKGEEARRNFLRAAQPILGEIMRESQAAVIVEQRTVFLSSSSIDVTDRAIAQLDAAIGDGSALEDSAAGAENEEGEPAPDE